jgi:hypothetical protein
METTALLSAIVEDSARMQASREPLRQRQSYQNRNYSDRVGTRSRATDGATIPVVDDSSPRAATQVVSSTNKGANKALTKRTLNDILDRISFARNQLKSAEERENLI